MELLLFLLFNCILPSRATVMVERRPYLGNFFGSETLRRESACAGFFPYGASPGLNQIVPRAP